MIKLLLGPISSKYDEMESKEKQPKPSQQDAGYNSADDFDDDEDDFADGVTDDDSDSDGGTGDDADDSDSYVSQRQVNNSGSGYNSGGQGPDADNVD